MPYRDELEAALAQQRALEHEVQAEREAHAATRAKLAEYDEVLGKLQSALHGTPARPRPARRVSLVVAVLVAGFAGTATLFAVRSRQKPTNQAMPPEMTSALLRQFSPPPEMPEAPASEAPPARPAPPFGSSPCAPKDAFVQITRGTKTERYTAGCMYSPDHPYAEILEPTKPDFIVGACKGDLRFQIFGPASKLPGDVGTPVMWGGKGGPDVVLHDERGERKSETSSVRVNRFGNVGEWVDGEFSATIPPGLNEETMTVRGRFHVCRAKDRYRP